MHRTVKLITVPLLFSNVLFAQTGLKVHITDSASGKPRAYATIVIAKEHGIYAGGYGESYGGATDTSGWSEVEPMDTGVYDVMATYPGYQNNLIKGILVKPDEITQLEIKMKPDSTATGGYSIMDDPKQKATPKKE